MYLKLLKIIKELVKAVTRFFILEKAPSERAKSMTSKQEIYDRDDDKRSQAPSQISQKSEHKSVRSGVSKGSSETSSIASRSVYQVEGDEDDEWATLVKFDT